MNKTYYKADVFLSTENYWTNPETNEIEGLDPNTYRNIGYIKSYTASSLEGLKQQVERDYFSLEKPIGADVQILDGRIEIQYDGEHDYRTPKEEQIPFLETASIYIFKVEETILDLENEYTFSGVAR